MRLGVASFVKCGEVWTFAGGPDYTGKPRPANVVQDDAFNATATITIIIPSSRTSFDAPPLRVQIEPSDRNRLRVPSQLMIDKITTVVEDQVGAPHWIVSRVRIDLSRQMA
jgi:mRNA interferase MazF